MLAVTGAIKGAGLGRDVLLLTDGRFSGGTTGLCVGRRTAAHGGPIAFVRDGDPIAADLSTRTLELRVDDAELARRRRAGGHRGSPTGVLGKYARLVGSARGVPCARRRKARATTRPDEFDSSPSGTRAQWPPSARFR